MFPIHPARTTLGVKHALPEYDTYIKKSASIVSHWLLVTPSLSTGKTRHWGRPGYRTRVLHPLAVMSIPRCGHASESAGTPSKINPGEHPRDPIKTFSKIRISQNPTIFCMHGNDSDSTADSSLKGYKKKRHEHESMRQKPQGYRLQRLF